MSKIYCVLAKPVKTMHVVYINDHDPTIMLLMGMCMSLTKKPMKPMMVKPMSVAIAIC